MSRIQTFKVKRYYFPPLKVKGETKNVNLNIHYTPNWRLQLNVKGSKEHWFISPDAIWKISFICYSTHIRQSHSFSLSSYLSLSIHDYMYRLQKGQKVDGMYTFDMTQEYIRMCVLNFGRLSIRTKKIKIIVMTKKLKKWLAKQKRQRQWWRMREKKIASSQWRIRILSCEARFFCMKMNYEEVILICAVHAYWITE